MADEMQFEDQGQGEQPGMTGYTIEITVGQDGQITVGTESGEYESAEEQGAAEAGEEKSAGKPVQSFKQAMELVMEIYRNNGQMPGGDDEFMSGFGEAPQQPGELA